jgi:presenilin-like A22 family membrane protease
MQRLHYLSIGAVSGALLGWLTLFILWYQFKATRWRPWRGSGSYSEYINQRVPDAYWRWSVYAALVGALIGLAVVVFKVCARLPGHPLIC